MLTPEQLIICAELSSDAYLNPDQRNVKQYNLSFIKTLNSHKTDTQGFIVADDVNKILFIVFRGTQQIVDFITDIKIAKSPIHLKNGIGDVHEGTLNAYKSIKKDLLETFSHDYSEYTIIFTGHSLGGGIATIAASLFNSSQSIYVVTFGSPKVGNKKFKNLFNSLIPNTSRFVYEADIVPFWPVFLPYFHVGVEYRIDKDGNYLKEWGFFQRLFKYIKAFIRRHYNKEYEIASIKDHSHLYYITALKERAKKISNNQ